MYADVKTWVDRKWVDYIAPQLYWEHGHRLAAYDVLAPWWRDLCKDRSLYIGMGVYRMVNAKSGPYVDSKEILKQIATERNEKADGGIMYSLVSFSKIGSDLSNQLKKEAIYGTIAIPPTMPWLGSLAPVAPDATIVRRGNTASLSWNKGLNISGSLKFLVYRFSKNEAINLEDATKIIALTQSNSFNDEVNDGKSYRYVVTALDRLWNESRANKVLE